MGEGESRLRGCKATRSYRTLTKRLESPRPYSSTAEAFSCHSIACRKGGHALGGALNAADVWAPGERAGAAVEGGRSLRRGTGAGEHSARVRAAAVLEQTMKWRARDCGEE